MDYLIISFVWSCLEWFHRPLGDGVQCIAQTHYQWVVIIVIPVQQHYFLSWNNRRNFDLHVALLYESPVKCVFYKAHDDSISNYIYYSLVVFVQIKHRDFRPRSQQWRCCLCSPCQKFRNYPSRVCCIGDHISILKQIHNMNFDCCVPKFIV